MAVDPLAYRQVMSRLATGVTVLTTRSGDRHETLTANAVMSASLSPVLLVASVQAGSRWAAAARTAGAFAVNVLSDGQEPLSRWCAGPQRHAEPEAVLRHPSRTTASGLLVFDDALAAFECVLHAEHPVGDHDLLVGEVVDMRVRDAGAPLLYFGSDYASLVRRPAAVPTASDALAVTG